MSDRNIFNISFFNFWSTISIIVIVMLVVFDLQVLSAPESIQVQYIPDDAFYYLVLAKNFRKLGVWTFDSGYSLTSGFHPLLAYLLTLIYTVFQPSDKMFLQYGIALSSLLPVFGMGFSYLDFYCL
jgi:hypothetical protein